MSKKPYEHDDPMELVGAVIPGDVETMAEVMVEEFMRMGYDDEALMELFRNPFYQATHWVYRLKGESYVRALITRLRKRWPVHTAPPFLAAPQGTEKSKTGGDDDGDKVYESGEMVSEAAGF